MIKVQHTTVAGRQEAATTRLAGVGNVRMAARLQLACSEIRRQERSRALVELHRELLAFRAALRNRWAEKSRHAKSVSTSR